MPGKRAKRPTSQAQRAVAHATCKGRGRTGMPKKVACEMARADKGGKLPKRKRGTRR